MRLDARLSEEPTQKLVALERTRRSSRGDRDADPAGQRQVAERRGQPADESGAKRRTKLVRIDTLRPNDWYVDRAKLDRIRAAWRRGEQASLPPAS